MPIERNLGLDQTRRNSIESIRRQQIAELRAQESFKKMNVTGPKSQLEILGYLASLNRLPEFRLGKPLDTQDLGKLEEIDEQIQVAEYSINEYDPNKASVNKAGNDSRIPKSHFAQAIDDFYQKAQDLRASVLFRAKPKQQERQEILGYDRSRLLAAAFDEEKLTNPKAKGSPSVLAKLLLKHSITPSFGHEDLYDHIIVDEVLSLLNSLDYQNMSPSEITQTESAIKNEIEKIKSSGLNIDLNSAKFVALALRAKQEKAFIQEQLILDQELNPWSRNRNFEEIREILHDSLKLSTKEDLNDKDLERLKHLTDDLDGLIDPDRSFKFLTGAQTLRLKNLAETLTAAFAKKKLLEYSDKIKQFGKVADKEIAELADRLIGDVLEKPLDIMTGAAKINQALLNLLKGYGEAKRVLNSLKELPVSAFSDKSKAEEVQDVLLNLSEKLETVASEDMYSAQTTEQAINVSHDFLQKEKNNRALMKDQLLTSKTLGFVNNLSDHISELLDPARQLLWKDPKSVIDYLQGFPSIEDGGLRYLNSFIVHNLEKLSQTEDTLRSTIQYLDAVLMDELNENGESNFNETDLRGLEALTSSYSESYLNPSVLTEKNAQGEVWFPFAMQWFADYKESN